MVLCQSGCGDTTYQLHAHAACDHLLLEFFLFLSARLQESSVPIKSFIQFQFSKIIFQCPDSRKMFSCLMKLHMLTKKCCSDAKKQNKIHIIDNRKRIALFAGLHEDVTLVLRSLST